MIGRICDAPTRAFPIRKTQNDTSISTLLANVRGLRATCTMPRSIADSDDDVDEIFLDAPSRGSGGAEGSSQVNGAGAVNGIDGTNEQSTGSTGIYSPKDCFSTCNNIVTDFLQSV